jgi:four helix bundle protein
LLDACCSQSITNQENVMKNFRDLKVWEKAHHTTLTTYKTTAHYPKDELYGLTSQTRRASVSVPANIAEGCGRGSDADFARFLQNSMGSASELEYLFLLAHDLGYLTESDYKGLNSQVVEVKRMLASFIQTLKAGR